jgi:hypothetical protein
MNAEEYEGNANRMGDKNEHRKHINYLCDLCDLRASARTSQMNVYPVRVYCE